MKKKREKQAQNKGHNLYREPSQVTVTLHFLLCECSTVLNNSLQVEPQNELISCKY